MFDSDATAKTFYDWQVAAIESVNERLIDFLYSIGIAAERADVNQGVYTPKEVAVFGTDGLSLYIDLVPVDALRHWALFLKNAKGNDVLVAYLEEGEEEIYKRLAHRVVTFVD